MLRFWVFCYFFAFGFQNNFGLEQRISLNSDNNNQTWSFYATKNTTLKGYANVPGDIYTDLYRFVLNLCLLGFIG